MFSKNTSLRHRLLGLGLALGAGTGVADAGEIFDHISKPGSKGGNSRGVGAIYVPANLPASAPAPVFGLTLPTTKDSGAQSLEKAFEAEHYSILAASAKAAFQAEVEGKQKLLKKLGGNDTKDSTDSKLSDEVNARLEEITERLKKLDSRMNEVERLLLIHDNYLQEIAKTKNLVTPSVPGPDPKKQN